jgi:hypothetical protein
MKYLAQVLEKLMLVSVIAFLIGAVSGSVVIFFVLGLIFLLFALACLSIVIWHNNRNCILLIAWILKKIPVKLISFNGETYYSLATEVDETHMKCAVYWLNNIGQIKLLLSNGLVSEESESSYIKFWLPMRKAERVEHQLRYDVPDWETILSCKDEDKRFKMIRDAYTEIKGSTS